MSVTVEEDSFESLLSCRLHQHYHSSLFWSSENGTSPINFCLGIVTSFILSTSMIKCIFATTWHLNTHRTGNSLYVDLAITFTSESGTYRLANSFPTSRVDRVALSPALIDHSLVDRLIAVKFEHANASLKCLCWLSACSYFGSITGIHGVYTRWNSVGILFRWHENLGNSRFHS